MLKTVQTYFKSLAVVTPEDFKSISGHILTLCMKGLKINAHDAYILKL